MDSHQHDLSVVSAFLSSPVGMIRISGNENFVTEVSFVNDHAGDECVTPPAAVKTCMAELENYFRGTLRNFSVSTQQEGSDFQQLVWKHLQSVAYGKTCSYGDIAKKTGDANNTRAVGSANNKNHLAIIVPCHRVIGQDGSMTGYGGGLWRKKWLLQHEARIANGVLMLFEV
jgi:methylated-DNA-[protein]-cysteine S-methyltransferase